MIENETIEALALIGEERERQRGIGTDGELTSRDALVATAVHYASGAVRGIRRTEGDEPIAMLVKSAAVLVDAIERELEAGA